MQKFEPTCRIAQFSEKIAKYFLFDFTETGSIKERIKIKTGLNHFVLLRLGLLSKLAAIVDLLHFWLS